MLYLKVDPNADSKEKMNAQKTKLYVVQYKSDTRDRKSNRKHRRSHLRNWQYGNTGKTGLIA